MRTLFALVVVSVCFIPTAKASLPKVDKLKAAYMYNFTRFISWPASQSLPLVFCVQQPTDFVIFFNALVNSKPGGDQHNKLHIVTLDSATHCDVAYLPGPQITLPQLTATTMIITDAPGAPDLSPLFTFYQEQNRLRFEIDLTQAQRLNVTISSELLKVARIK